MVQVGTRKEFSSSRISPFVLCLVFALLRSEWVWSRPWVCSRILWCLLWHILLCLLIRTSTSYFDFRNAYVSVHHT